MITDISIILVCTKLAEYEDPIYLKIVNAYLFTLIFIGLLVISIICYEVLLLTNK